MRFGTIVAATGLAAMLGAGAAQASPMLAAPVAPPAAAVRPAVDVGPAPKLELVRGGCGWGAHRTWHGYCHLNYGWRGRVRARWGWYRWHRW